jgi:hypothetical protein
MSFAVRGAEISYFLKKTKAKTEHLPRCGRCGLWSKYPDNHHEQLYSGVCVWYQIRFRDDQVWEGRDCNDFFERIPGFHVMDHFEYKTKRDALGSTYRGDKFARKVAVVGLVLSIIGIALSFLPQ